MRYNNTTTTTVLAEYDFFNSTDGWILRLDVGNGAIDFDKKISSTTYYSRNANSTLSENTIYSIAIVVRGQHTRFFVDGVKSSSPDSVTIANHPSSTDSIEIADVLYGELDDFQFYNRAVVDDSVLYLHDNPGKSLMIKGDAGQPVIPSSDVNPELWLQFEANAADSSGNARDATYAGGYSASSPPQGSYWLTAAGNADVVPLDFTHNDTITMFCRIRFNTTDDGIIARYSYLGSSEGWIWRLDAGSGAQDFDKKVGGVDDKTRGPNSSLSTNTTYSVAVVVRGAHTRFFKDGVWTPSPVGDSVFTNNGATYPTTSDSIKITDNWWGQLDDFQFYNRHVPNDSILYLHNNPGSALE